MDSSVDLNGSPDFGLARNPSAREVFLLIARSYWTEKVLSNRAPALSLTKLICSYSLDLALCDEVCAKLAVPLKVDETMAAPTRDLIKYFIG